MRDSVMYSVVIPVYNDEQALYGWYKRLKKLMAHRGGSFELIFVNDCSRDRSADTLRVFCAADLKVRAIHLAYPAGRTAAAAAGTAHAAGSKVFVMDPERFVIDTIIDRDEYRLTAFAEAKPYAIAEMDGFTRSPLWDEVVYG